MQRQKDRFRWLRAGPGWIRAVLVWIALSVVTSAAQAQTVPRVVDIPTRPGVTQRFLYLAPDHPRAAVILYPGGHGGLQIDADGGFGWGEGNFLVRTRQDFVAAGLAVAIVDAPSDRQSPPYLDGFRQSAEHAADAKAVIAWVREQAKVPVWLVGTSRGTQSVAAIAIALADGGGPDGIVLTSTILRENRGGRPVTAMDLGALKIPVLVVHNKDDGCKLCPVSATSELMDGLKNAPRKELIVVSGGISRGDPCEAMSYHGFNGLEGEVVGSIAKWIETP
jgi:pimeloyl-ACP methyl ester carboxylesterase